MDGENWGEAKIRANLFRNNKDLISIWERSVGKAKALNKKSGDIKRLVVRGLRRLLDKRMQRKTNSISNSRWGREKTKQDVGSSKSNYKAIKSFKSREAYPTTPGCISYSEGQKGPRSQRENVRASPLERL